MNKPNPHWITLLTYIFYGLMTCIIVVFLRDSFEQLIEDIPWSGVVAEALVASEFPIFGCVIIVIFGTVLVLALVGFVCQKLVVNNLTKIPALAKFSSGVEEIGKRIASGERMEENRVVWVHWPNQDIQTIGVITGPPAATGTTPAWLIIVLFPTAGQIIGGMLRRIRPERVTYTDLSINEALAFVSSSGATDIE